MLFDLQSVRSNWWLIQSLDLALELCRMAERAEMFREPTLYDGPLPRLGVRRRTQAVSAQKAAARAAPVRRNGRPGIQFPYTASNRLIRAATGNRLVAAGDRPLDVLRPVPGDGWRGSAVLRLRIHADPMMIDELPAFPAGVEKQQDGGER